MRVQPGDRIDGRYLVYEQTDENWGVCGWRARDEVLGRFVLLTTFHPDDPRAPALVSSARDAATVSDHRFVRVLDAHIDRPNGFLVREWTPGQTLADLLGAGPLTDDAARSICQNVAEALHRAHEKGQYHLCVDPSSVTITTEGAVRVRGLGTAAVLRGVNPSPDGPARDDAIGVGRLLYASLTGKVPSHTSSPLPVVPVVDGHIPAPRQLRAGVSPLLDAITVRALGSGRSHRFAPYATPGEVAEALRHVAAEQDVAPHPVVSAAHGRRSGDVVDVAPPPPPRTGRPALDPAVPPPAQPPLPPETGSPPPRRRPWMRIATIATAVLLGIGAFLLGLELIAANRVPDLDPADSPLPTEAATQPAETPTDAGSSGDPQPVAIAAVSDFDPLGNGSENPERTGLAVDGDLQTAWPTQTYFDPLELQKAGVGLLLDLGSTQTVSEVELVLLNQTSDVEIRVAPPNAQSAPGTPEGFVQLTRAERAGTALTLTGDPRETRYVLVWFTRLPPTEEGWRGGVANVVVRG